MKERFEKIKSLVEEIRDNGVTLQYICDETGFKYMELHNFLYAPRKVFNIKMVEKIKRLEKYFKI